jgi:hypothetical protein
MCESCAGTRFKRSRLQWKDLGTLAMLHYPVRCLSCSKRQSVALPVARRAASSSVKQVKAPHDGTPWSKPASLSRAGGGGAPIHQRAPVAMPDLHGVRLPHVAHQPPGDGQNLAS